MVDLKTLDAQLCRLWDEGRRFQRCKGVHSGSVVIFASGPSAAQFPLERYAGLP